jgi:hypothetical protein
LKVLAVSEGQAVLQSAQSQQHGVAGFGQIEQATIPRRLFQLTEQEYTRTGHQDAGHGKEACGAVRLQHSEP